MFEKILIANRGEIACRVIATAKRLGIATVAVYSEVDSTAKHVDEADQAVCIGPAAATESYLAAERIVQVCKDTGAAAVHPGYGFLSENTAFVELLEKEGIVFIGPGSHAIKTMGDKITSKLLAETVGVNIIPGYNDVVADADQAVKISSGIGFPVMLKASTGGGGKGMRIAHNAQECRAGFERATSEAKSSFGDGRIFIEKLISHPRHIEIQVLADAHGNVIALNERECSIQRRHQKVIEESPSPFLDDDTRKAMSDQAIGLARAVNYKSAGTVEFIVDADKNFYFLEMNTRLQVEHPVTEMITGLDLVEWMIRVAAGERLTISQKDIGINGWSIESRVYAESPARGFLPSTGRLKGYQPPPVSNRIRVDAGVLEGSDISMFYDPMIAKLITWGGTRKQAIATMMEALDQYYIRGVDTNLPFVSSIMRHPKFASGELSTNFIDEEYPEGFIVEPLEMSELARLVCAMSTIHHRYYLRAGTISNQVKGYGRNYNADWVVIIRNVSYSAHVSGENGKWTVRFEGQEYRVKDRWKFVDRIFRGHVNSVPLFFQIEKRKFSYEVRFGSFAENIGVFSPAIAVLIKTMPVRKAPDMSRFMLSPMPGLLVHISVSVGQHIKVGDELAVIEAMKMENVLRAEQDCIIAKILVEAGVSLEVGQPIMEFE